MARLGGTDGMLASGVPGGRRAGLLDVRSRAGRRADPGRRWARARLGVDVAMLFATVAVAELGAARAGVEPTPLHWLLAFPGLVVLLMAMRGMYRPRLFVRVLDDLRVAASTTAVAAMTILSLRVLVTDVPWVAAQTARLWVFATVYVMAGRAVVSLSEMRARRNGEAVRRTLIVGAGRVGRLMAQRLLDHPEMGLRPVGFLDKEPLVEGDGRLPVLGASWDLEAVVERHEIDHVVVAFSTAPHRVLLEVSRQCERLGIPVSFVPRLFERVSERLSVEHLGGLPLVTPQRSDPDGWQFAAKYAADRVAAAVLLVLALPVLAAAGLAVLATSGRPILFRQARAGRDGKVFGMLKFRTMTGTPEDLGEADGDWADEQLSGARPADVVPAEADRSTPVGSVLRRYSIDELPQLWNVLVGDMSLVGPRPERTGYVERFEGAIYRYGERHRVKAGITGWAQIHGLRGRTSLADRIEWDNFYIENWSLWLDVKILLNTLLAVLRFRRFA